MNNSGIEQNADTWRREPIAILASGGIDSAVLIGEAVRTSPKVVPIYVRCGTFWDDAEVEYLHRFLREIRANNLCDLVTFELTLDTVYGKHWSTTGEGTPDQDTADEAVYLPGRNLLLFSQPSIWCTIHNIPRLGVGTLSANPFSDATPDFYFEFAKLVLRATGKQIEVVAPYLRLEKSSVLRIGKDLPLHLTMSCIQPIRGLHCGACNKCAERRHGFEVAGVQDRTQYARTPAASK